MPARIPNEEWYKRLPDLEPGQTVTASGKAWFICDKGHRSYTQVYHRVAGIGCSKCNKNGRKLLLGDREWYDRLPDLEVGQTGLKALEKAWFVCQNGHRFDITLNSRRKGHGCRYCSKQYLQIESLPIPAVVQHLTALGVTPQYRFLVLATIIPVA